jgi:hypothetical protein
MTDSWQEETSQDWFTEVESWDWQMHPDGWLKAGTCPRCGHQMSIVRGAGGGLTFALDEPVTAFCNCEEEHDGRPTTIRRGCGQNARISPPDPGAGS